MGFVKIVKIKSLLEGAHPNNIEEGSERSGYTEKEPTIGESFILNRMSSWFATSVVTEIIDKDTFKTLNSIYKIIRANEAN